MTRTQLMAFGFMAFATLSIAYAQPYPDTRSGMALDIRQQPLEKAIYAWSEQTGYQVLIPAEQAVSQHAAPDVKGIFTAEEALKVLLASTDLTYQFVNPRTVVIAQSDASGEGAEGSSWRHVRLAKADLRRAEKTGSLAAQSGNNPRNETDREVLAEVTVTAQKREERLIDTPQSVTVLSADALTKLGATQFRDFANTVPGLSFQTAGAGSTAIALRGVSVGADVGPTVAVYVDEVPYGSSSAFAQGAQTRFDMAPFNLTRLEVLRGPQGTLYGASSLGGLIKYVTKAPDSTRFSGDVQAGFSGSEHGSTNFDAAAGVNLPLVTEKVALRMSGFESRDGGFVNNVALGDRNANKSDTYGGSVDLLYTPTEPLSIRVTGSLQNISRDGEATVDYTRAGGEPFGSLGQSRRLAEPFDHQFRLGSATVEYDFGPAQLTSISSYQRAHHTYNLDVSAIYVPLFAGPAFGSRSYSAMGFGPDTETKKFTQEIRLAGPESRLLEWVIGGFYTDERSHYGEVFRPYDLAGQPAPNDIYNFLAVSKYEEYAAFGDLTWHFNARFDLTGGMRYARNNQDYTQFGSGILVSSRPPTSASENVTTYLANARYKFSDLSTGYVRFATGYRPGGPNISANDPSGAPLGPPTFQADRLKSYEIGYKAETPSHRFSADVALYYIDWSNIQVTIIRTVAFRSNAPGGATSKGGELALTARPIDSLTFSGTFAYQNAYMNEADPPVLPAFPLGRDLRNAKGERLPNTPRTMGTFNVDYEIFHHGLRPTVGASVRFVGDRTVSFNGNTAQQYVLPSYDIVDLRAGFDLSSASVQLYAHNLLDERGQLASMRPQFGNRIAITQPRTIGVSVTKQF